MLQPGQNTMYTLSVMLMGTGIPREFNLDVHVSDESGSTGFSYGYSYSQFTYVEQDTMSSENLIEIHSRGVGFSVTLIIVVQSYDDIGLSDYITFDMTNVQTQQTVSLIILL